MPLTPTCNSPLSYFDYMHSLWSDYKAVKVVLKNVASEVWATASGKEKSENCMLKLRRYF